MFYAAVTIRFGATNLSDWPSEYNGLQQQQQQQHSHPHQDQRS
jgi:heme A synthase